jgi:hypothetical protein
LRLLTLHAIVRITILPLAQEEQHVGGTKRRSL